MGIYLNPENDLFRQAVNSRIFVDKTLLLDITNKKLDTNEKHICVSRPRRFGKSMAADMLVAYYSRGCDSKELFSGSKIAQTADFEKNLNKYNVIRFDVTKFTSKSENGTETTKMLEKVLRREICKAHPDMDFDDDYFLEDIISEIYAKYRIPFVFIIDEWDAVFRFFKTDTEGQNRFLTFLKDLLKDKDYVALDYATGIFPVRKYGKQSALNMYDEYSMTNQSEFAEYTGFTREEVECLCSEYSISADMMTMWYDGYNVQGYEIFNPRSVVRSIQSRIFDSYWTKTENFESLKDYIKMNFDGLNDKVTSMIAGEKLRVNTGTFQNDMVSMQTADDVLTLLIHLGYLTYDFDTKTCWIPNMEVQQEFINCVETGGYDNIYNAIKQSEKLVDLTISGDEKAVAEQIGKVHDDNISLIEYNDENSLSCVISLAYYYAREKYIIHREYPSGKGVADIVFIPRKNVDQPAMVVELKYDKSAEAAISQIKSKNYTDKIADYSGEIVLVGINYDKDTKKHECLIEKITK